MKTLTVLACAWLVAAALGCAAGEAESGGDVRVSSPDLVAISPGIQVVSDADEPLFFADGYYWLYRDRAWYRSDSYRSGFARIDVNMVPGELRTIQQPQIYAHYRRNQGRIYARGRQMQQREQPRPQGTQQQQYPQPQQQPPQQPIQQPPQQPMQQPQTEPQPSSPSQKPPVPNPMPSQKDDTSGIDHSLPMNGEHDHAPPSQPHKTSPDDRDRNAQPDRAKEDKDKKDKPYGE